MKRYYVVGTALAIVASVLLSGCSGGAKDGAPAGAPQHAASATSASAVVAVAESSGHGAGGQQADARDGDTAIRLNILSEQDIKSASLSGELGCSFSTAARSPLLIAMGDVGSSKSAQGIVKIHEAVEPVSSRGGFDAMSKGASFQGKRVTVQVTVTGAAQGGGESPARPAMLRVKWPDGTSQSLKGYWECGP